LITEQPAVFMYLADLYPEAKLAPPIGDPLRGPYLRWLVYYGSCFEPALVDRSMKREPAAPSTCPYGDFDTMLKTLTDQLEQGPYMLGDTFSAADVLWGTALNWTTMFKLVPELPVIRAYIDRVLARPAMQRATAADTELAAAQAA
jgi:glutathione S-transferase